MSRHQRLVCLKDVDSARCASVVPNAPIVAFSVKMTTTPALAFVVLAHVLNLTLGSTMLWWHRLTADSFNLARTPLSATDRQKLLGMGRLGGYWTAQPVAVL